MPFTKEEFETWHQAKLGKEFRPIPKYRPPPVTECIICGNPFGYGEGTVRDDFPICDICDDD
jgi:hypothetical protein